MIEEKNIERLPERDEALKRGFELILVKLNGTVQEKIVLGKFDFITKTTSKNFLANESFESINLSDLEIIPWFDIQPLKMRKMTLVETHDYLIEEKKLLCYLNTNDSIAFNASMTDAVVTKYYAKYGTLTPDGTFKPLPLIEEK